MQKFDPSDSQENKIEYYRSVVRCYVDSVNNKDLETILSLYAPNAEIHDPIGKRDISGAAALREFYEYVVSVARLEIVGPIRGSHLPVVAAPLVARRLGAEIDVITLTTFDDSGLIRDYAAYWGPTDLRQIDA